MLFLSFSPNSSKKTYQGLMPGADEHTVYHSRVGSLGHFSGLWRNRVIPIPIRTHAHTGLREEHDVNRRVRSVQMRSLSGVCVGQTAKRQASNARIASAAFRFTSGVVHAEALPNARLWIASGAAGLGYHRQCQGASCRGSLRCMGYCDPARPRFKTRSCGC